MNHMRLATLATVAGLGFLSGCQSCKNPCNGNGGLFSRFGSGHNGGCCEVPCCGTPVSSSGFNMGMGMPLGGCCDGGPMLGDPSMINGGIGLPVTGLPSSMGSGMVFPQGTIMGPAMNVPPPIGAAPATLPPPSNAPAPPPGPSTGPPPLLNPVPMAPGNGQATPTPAGPSSAQPSSRWWR